MGAWLATQGLDGEIKFTPMVLEAPTTQVAQTIVSRDFASELISTALKRST